MDELRYDYQGDVYALLKKSLLTWLATAEFGTDLFLGRDVQKSPRYIAYIRTEDKDAWQKYLSTQNAPPKRDLPMLILLPTDSLQQPSKENPETVSLDILVRDLLYASPRHAENLAEEYPVLRQYLNPLLRNSA